MSRPTYILWGTHVLYLHAPVRCDDDDKDERVDDINNNRILVLTQ